MIARDPVGRKTVLLNTRTVGATLLLLLGTVAAGYDADIIAVDGDPLTDATRLRQVPFVMKRGTVYKDTSQLPRSDVAS